MFLGKPAADAGRQTILKLSEGAACLQYVQCTLSLVGDEQLVLRAHASLENDSPVQVRWVPGGHVSAFLLQQPAFRTAILDSLFRLASPQAASSAADRADRDRPAKAA